MITGRRGRGLKNKKENGPFHSKDKKAPVLIDRLRPLVGPECQDCTLVAWYLLSTHLAREGRMTVTIGRRELLAALGGAAAWPIAARAQQAGVPLVGLLLGS